MNTRMKKARESANLSQKAAALSLHVSAPTVSEWESGKKSPTVANLKEIALLYGVSSDYLLGIDKEKTLTVIDERFSDLPELEQEIFKKLQQLSEDQKQLLLAQLLVLLSKQAP